MTKVEPFMIDCQCQSAGGGGGGGERNSELFGTRPTFIAALFKISQTLRTPLNNLMHKETVEVGWEAAPAKCFDKLKRSLCRGP